MMTIVLVFILVLGNDHNHNHKEKSPDRGCRESKIVDCRGKTGLDPKGIETGGKREKDQMIDRRHGLDMRLDMRLDM